MINNLYLLHAMLQQNPDVKLLMAPAASEVEEGIDDNCDKLIQRCWLSALQSLSTVHIATSHIKAGQSAHLNQTERHQIKDALAGFNAAVEQTLANDEIHVDDRDLRATLALSAETFVVPVYAEFLEKFANLPFSTKNRDKYIVYSRQSLSDAIKRRILGRA